MRGHRGWTEQRHKPPLLNPSPHTSPDHRHCVQKLRGCEHCTAYSLVQTLTRQCYMGQLTVYRLHLPAGKNW